MEMEGDGEGLWFSLAPLRPCDFAPLRSLLQAFPFEPLRVNFYG
jgi:hypothetical protein